MIEGDRAGRPFYERFGWAYDLLVDHRVEPWVNVVCETLRDRGLATGAEVLDAGCGTGRHAEWLARRGHHITLVDKSSVLLAQARRRLPTARAIRANLREVELHARFDAVACRGVLNDVISDQERDAVLGRFAEHLRPGGVVVLDVRALAATELRYGSGAQVKKVIDSARGRLGYSSTARLESGILHVHEEHSLHDHRGDIKAQHDFVMRPWSPDELIERLRRAGFKTPSISTSPGRSTRDRLLCIATTPSKPKSGSLQE